MVLRSSVGAALALTFALVLGLGGAGASTASSSGAWRTVSYLGMSFRVPADWPVVRVGSSTCVRFDVHAVYLGAQGARADCPADAVGRTEAVQMQPLASAGRAVRWGPDARLGNSRVRFATGTGAVNQIVVRIPARRALATIAFANDRRVADRILSTFTTSGTSAVGRSNQTFPSGPPAARRAATIATASPSTAAPTSHSAGIYRGLGFDACSAPSAAAMTAWLASPYHSVGVYIGGVNRACSQPNLDSSWVTTVENQGWRLVPTYVGRQAPCAYAKGMVSIGSSRARSEGRNAADDAAQQASTLGMPHGTPVYFDMEAYNAKNATCDGVVERFLSAWTNELHAQGFTSGVYSSADSGIAQLSRYYDNKSYARPDNIWIARWNGNTSVFGDPSVPDSRWAHHQRLHQYQGGHDEIYGGVTINIDNDSADGVVAGEGRVIVFDSDRTGSRQIFLIGRDGIGAVQLTSNSADNYAPALSPNGRQIAFTSTLHGNPDVWTMNINGTGLRRLTGKPGFDGYPTWKPNGKRLAFQSDRRGNMDLYTISAGGSGVTRLTGKASADERPSWSPDGSKIAFESNRSGNFDIWTIASDGTSASQLTFNSANDTAPDWSPDGSEIAFESTRTGGLQVFTISASGLTVTQVTNDDSANYAPCWSPDGGQIGFSSDRAAGSQLFVGPADGSSANQYTFAGSKNELCSWAD